MIKVLKVGFYTTIQDLGRLGFQEHGVPISGAMDLYASTLANHILGNNDADAVLEMAMTGPTLKFEMNTFISITGADLSPKLNEASLKLNHSILVKAGDVLSFGRLNYGFRVYLAVKGGFQSEVVMNSRSQYKNVTQAVVISKGDTLIIEKQNSINPANASVSINKNHFRSNVIEVSRGPEFEQLSEEQQELLLSKEFTISKEHSRMAYQLEGKLENQLKPIITSLVLPGTVQLTPSGKLIVLMRDCQTTGGYPRILQLAEKATSQLAQKQTNSIVNFRLTE